MFSSDKNVETIGQLAVIVKHYLGLQAEYLKLDVIDKTVRLIKALVLATISCFIIMTIVLYFSFAVAYWLAGYVGPVAGFIIVGCTHFIFFLLIAHFRKPWIERPLVHFLANLLLSK